MIITIVTITTITIVMMIGDNGMACTPLVLRWVLILLEYSVTLEVVCLLPLLECSVILVVVWVFRVVNN